MEIVKISNFEKLKGISEDWREYLIEKFSEINHKKWAPYYLLTGTVALQYWNVKRQWKYWENKGVDGPKPSFLGMGHTSEVFKGIGREDMGANKWGKEYGSIYGLYVMGKPTLVVNDPEVAREVSIKKFSIFTTRGRNKFNTAMGKLAPKFMTLLEGAAWKRQRSTITPFFSGARLNEQTPILVNSAQKVLDDVVVNLEKSGKGIETKELTKEYAMTAIMAAGFNIDPMRNRELLQKAIYHGNQLMGASLIKNFLFVFIPESVRYFFNLTTYPRETDTFFRGLAGKLLKDHKSETGKQRSDFVTLMSQNMISSSEEETATKGFSEDEVIAQSILFIIAGFNTTSDVLKTILYLLAMNPEFQTELHQTLKKEMNPGITYEGLKKVKIVDACIKESMRLYTPAPILSREADEDTVVAGIQIKKGMQVMWTADLIHKNEQYYNEPEAFNPHRFDGQESNTLQDDHWFGFGVGPRACPAVRFAFISMKVFISQLILNYEIVKTAETPERSEWHTELQGVGLGTTKPLIVGFKKRF